MGTNGFVFICFERTFMVSVSGDKMLKLLNPSILRLNIQMKKIIKIMLWRAWSITTTHQNFNKKNLIPRHHVIFLI